MDFELVHIPVGYALLGYVGKSGDSVYYQKSCRRFCYTRDLNLAFLYKYKGIAERYCSQLSFDHVVPVYRDKDGSLYVW